MKLLAMIGVCENSSAKTVCKTLHLIRWALSLGVAVI